MEFILLYLLYQENQKRTNLEKERFQREVEMWEREVNAQTIKMVNQFRESLNDEDKQKLANIQKRIKEAENQHSEKFQSGSLLLIMSCTMLLMLGLAYNLKPVFSKHSTSKEKSLSNDFNKSSFECWIKFSHSEDC